MKKLIFISLIIPSISFAFTADKSIAINSSNVASLNIDNKNLQQNASLEKINAELKKLENITVDFRQMQDGKSETGSIYFKKNQGLYLKYKNQPVTLLVTKSTTTYYDSKLDQKSQVPTQNSASKIFVSTLEINNNLFDIHSVENVGEATKIVANVKGMKDEGFFTMYFSKSDNILRRVDIESVDGKDKVRIDLYSHSFGKISNERFKSINIGKDSISL